MSINKDLQKAPNLRFKGFTDDWEQRKLKSIGKTFTGLSGKTKDDFGHGEAEYIPYTNIFNNPITDVDQLESIEIDNKQNSVVYGDILFTTSSETPEEVGMSSVWMHEKENVYLNSFCFGFRPIEKHYPLYLAFLLRSSDMRKKFTILAQGISRYNISKNKVLELTIALPAISEQIKIGNTLKYLDDTITLHQRKLDQLKQLKEALLQQMFPGKGETVPKLRFAGFEGDWEERKLGKIIKTHSIKPYIVEPTDKGNYPIIQQGDNSIYGYADGEPFYSYQGVTLFGDHTVSIYKPSRPFFIATDALKILSADDIDGYFLYILLMKYKPQSQGYKRHFTILKQENVWITENRDEQQKIGKLFKNLESNISFYQQKLEQLKNIKQVLLQNMFI